MAHITPPPSQIKEFDYRWINWLALLHRVTEGEESSQAGWNFFQTITASSGTTQTSNALPIGIIGVRVLYEGVSHNGAGSERLDLKTTPAPSGGNEKGFTSNGDAGTTVDWSTSTAISTLTNAASHEFYGSIELLRNTPASNIWTVLVQVSGASRPNFGSGGWILDSNLETINFTWSAGASFDSGKIHIYTT